MQKLTAEEASRVVSVLRDAGEGVTLLARESWVLLQCSQRAPRAAHSRPEGDESIECSAGSVAGNVDGRERRRTSRA